MASDIDGVPKVERVRRSVGATRSHGTAVLRFLPAVMKSEPDLDAVLAERWPRLGAAVGAWRDTGKKLTAALHRSEIPGLAGRIDFVNERSIFSRGPASWTLQSPGQEFLGEPGEWELEVFEDDTIGSDDPFWLLEVIAAATDTTAPPRPRLALG